MKLFASMGLVAALWTMSAEARSQASVIHLDFNADVQADGVPANIVANASLSPALQAMVQKQVAGWRYRMGTWQGAPVPATVSQRIVAEALPVTSGGFALRIKEVSYPTVTIGRDGMHKGISRMPPVYPKELQRQAVGGILVYAMRIDSSGKPRDVELVHPLKLNRVYKLLDAASRNALAQWTFEPTKVAGEVVDCRPMIPMRFSITGDPPVAEPDTSAYRAAHADVCPASPVLLTKAEGTML
ncbi:MAG: energy transducer TonB [Thermomonas sp.]